MSVAYHPWFSPFGTKNFSDGNLWYNTTDTVNSLYDCVVNAGTGNGRPDSKVAEHCSIEGQNGLICFAIPNAKQATYKHLEEVKRNLTQGYIENGGEMQYDVDGVTLITNKSPYLATYGTTTTEVEVLADPANYSESIKSLLASGVGINLISNLVDDGGNSNLPDGTKTTFKLSKKVTQQLQVLKSTDSGVTWSTESVTFDNVGNTVTFGTAPATTDLILVSNTIANQPVIKASIQQTVEAIDNFAITTDSNDITKYNGLMNIVGGVVQTGTSEAILSTITKVNGDVFSFTDDATSTTPTAIPFVASDGFVGVFGSNDNVIDKSTQYIKCSSIKV